MKNCPAVLQVFKYLMEFSQLFPIFNIFLVIVQTLKKNMLLVTCNKLIRRKGINDIVNLIGIQSKLISKLQFFIQAC